MTERDKRERKRGANMHSYEDRRKGGHATIEKKNGKTDQRETKKDGYVVASNW